MRKSSVFVFLPCSVALILFSPTPTRAQDSTSSPRREIFIGSQNLIVDRQTATYTGDVKAERGDLTLACDKATSFFPEGRAKQPDRVRCEGNVEAVRGEMKVRGQTADFDNRTGMLVLTGSPSAQAGQNQMFGDEVRYEVERNVVQVKPARTIFYSVPAPRTPSSSPATSPPLPQAATSSAPIHVDADLFTLHSAKREATWSGNVKVKRNELRMSCGLLIADYLPSQEIDQLRCTRGVDARERDIRATGGRAVFDPQKDLVTLTGSPVVTQGRNRTEGAKILFYPTKQRFVVENATSRFPDSTLRGAMPQESAPPAPTSPTENPR